MGVCGDCGTLFPRLMDKICHKCKELADVTSDAERKAIEAVRGQAKPQCEVCAMVYRYLRASKCGACSKQMVDLEGDASLSKDLLERAITAHETASEHRLRQPSSRPMNAALQAAHKAKESIAAAKLQAKGNMFIIQITLSSGGAPKKVQILPILKKMSGSDSTTELFEQSKNEIKDAFKSSPAYQSFQNQHLNFEQPVFGVGSSKVHQLEPKIGTEAETVEAFFNSLKSGGLLTDSDIKDKKIPLQLFFYHIMPETDNEEEDLDSPTYRTSTRKSAVASTARKQGPSSKRKASNSLSSSVPVYSSTFRPRKLVMTGTPVDVEVHFDRYQFTMTTFKTDEMGNVTEHMSIEERTIKIARDWQANIGDEPKGGYIAKGFMKYAFLGRFEDKRYAIFQCKPINSSRSLNLVDLTAELRLMALGQFFSNSFKRRAEMHGVEIPSLRWNFANAFLGSVTSDLQSPPEGDEKDTRSLLFPEFLAAPLLLTRGLYSERKFSGCEEAGNNKDPIGAAVDAYAHHVLVDSEGTYLMTDLQDNITQCIASGVVGPDQEIILYDPQAHSFERNTGFWDKGVEGIKKWQSEHKCKSLCRKLNLHKAEVKIREKTDGDIDDSRSGPLRHGFPSPPPKIESP
ncbi:hypothetical protein H0H93_003661 [Arthromyces matolae]|nr:hypothetical protein H0H93_003661 [Arthromyces matolae]